MPKLTHSEEGLSNASVFDYRVGFGIYPLDLIKDKLVFAMRLADEIMLVL